MMNTWSGLEPGAHFGAGVGGTIGSGGGGGGGGGAPHLPSFHVQRGWPLEPPGALPQVALVLNVEQGAGGGGGG
eukprot:COSAG02_NODE_44365_length_367_cov_0.570896_1_plen_73_part_10